MVVRRTHKEKRLERSLGIHTSHNMAGNIRSLVANTKQNFKKFNFWAY